MYINITAPRQYIIIIIYYVVIYYYCASRRCTTDLGVVERGGGRRLSFLGTLGPAANLQIHTHTYIYIRIYIHAQINILTVMSARGPRVCAGDCI